MHYQPILDLTLNKVRKVEALARLRDNDRLVMPGEFLPQLDDDALYELFVLGLDQALRDRQRWKDGGFSIDLSVNLPSCALVEDDRFFEATRRALMRYGCPPAALTLEILEGRELRDAGHAADLFQRFSDYGVMMAEDDLGSGHSSLTRLRELAFDWVKIDRGIVQLTGRDNVEVLQFVYQLTRLSHALGKSVIVEGVEDPAMIEAVRILGADAVQGYGVARPMAAHAISDSLRNGTPPPIGQPGASMLPRIAQLLLVEERLHICQVNGTRSRSAEKCFQCVYHEPHARTSISECDLLQRQNFEADVDAIYPPDCSYGASKRDLVDAAIHFGIRSSTYREARRRLACSPR